MIRTSDRPETGWNLLLAVSLVGIVVGGWFAIAKPKAASVPEVQNSSTVEGIHHQTQAIDEKAKPAREEVRLRSWNLTPEMFGSSSLAKLTSMCEKNHLQLAGFHLGRTFPAAGMQEAPVAAIVEGGFMDVMALISQIEEPESKLAISQIHMSASGGGDHVRANLDLTGFLYKEVQ